MKQCNDFMACRTGSEPVAILKPLESKEIDDI